MIHPARRVADALRDLIAYWVYDLAARLEAPDRCDCADHDPGLDYPPELTFHMSGDALKERLAEAARHGRNGCDDDEAADRVLLDIELSNALHAGGGA